MDFFELRHGFHNAQKVLLVVGGIRHPVFDDFGPGVADREGDPVGEQREKGVFEVGLGDFLWGGLAVDPEVLQGLFVGGLHFGVGGVFSPFLDPLDFGGVAAQEDFGGGPRQSLKNIFPDALGPVGVEKEKPGAGSRVLEDFWKGFLKFSLEVEHLPLFWGGGLFQSVKDVGLGFDVDAMERLELVGDLCADFSKPLGLVFQNPWAGESVHKKYLFGGFVRLRKPGEAFPCHFVLGGCPRLVLVVKL